MFITKMSLSRRQLLRGLGAALSLPLLDAMVPALSAAAAAAKPVRRLGFVVHAERRDHAELDPDGDRKGFRAQSDPETSRGRARSFLVLSGLSNNNVRGSHAISSTSWLTGVAPKKSVTDLDGRITVDQIAAQYSGRRRSWPHLNLDWSNPISPANATAATAAPTRTRSRGVTPPRRCRWRRTRG